MVFQLSPTISNYFHLSSRRFPTVSYLSSTCSSLVSQLCPSCLPDLSQMWFPRCASFLQGFSACCLLVFHLSPTCALPMVSRCGFTVVARCGFPDVPPQLPPMFLHLLSHCVRLSPRCGLPVAAEFQHLLTTLLLVSQMWSTSFPLYVVCQSDCWLAAFHLSPRCTVVVIS